MQRISTREEYNNVVNRGLEPLSDWRHFVIPIALRIEIQNGLFSGANIPAANETFYRYCWAHKIHVCEEYMKPLDWYSAVYISHILSKGAHPEMAHDPRNVNILSFDAHQKWETGNRETMRIFEENQLIIKILKKDYGRE